MTRPKTASLLIPEAVQIVAKQLGCDQAEAMTRLRERAEYGQYRLHNYALLVIQGMVRFGD